MQKPLISILTPFKNTEAYLVDCIESIIDQTYAHWELLIIDDHSSDSSASIVETYAKKDTRIKHFKNTGNGIIDALQLAFLKSQGTYITRMDSDDIMVPIKLEVLLNGLINSGRKYLAIGQVAYFSATGISDGYNRYEIWLNKLTKSGNNYSEIYKECVVPSPCWMLHRDDLIECDAFNPNRYPEDYDLTFRFYQHNYACIPCDQVLHKWRDYATRTSRTHEHYAQNYFLDIKLRYFLKLDYNPNRVLTVWGAGNKGKTIAKQLISKDVPFVWICDNLKKIGKHIYSKELFNFDTLSTLENPQSIVTVANQEAQEEITTYFKAQNMISMQDYFFFC